MEREFNFGSLTAGGISGQLNLTLKNNSMVPANLYLDLRPNEFAPGVECLNIKVQELGKKYSFKQKNKD
jgi:hypothetical protein